jgi:hypothetical protein
MSPITTTLGREGGAAMTNVNFCCGFLVVIGISKRRRRSTELMTFL